MRSLTWQNEQLRTLRAKDPIRTGDLDQLEQALEERGTLVMQPLASGLFPAAAVGPSASASGYGKVWVRDNVYVACAHEALGQLDVAVNTALAIFQFFWNYRARFQAIVAGIADPDEVTNRPNIRFDGESLEELSGQRWPHAQNDALGYALWLFARLAAAGAIQHLDAQAVEMLSLFVRYFAAIRYWRDEDSGHWEEVRRRSASSIGAVVAGLEAVLALARARGGELRNAGFKPRLLDQVSNLTEKGRAALAAILPGECAQLSPRQNRRYDAALLFLLCPLDVVAAPHADLILSDVDRFLTSDIGVRRYLGDSYWAPDYDTRLSASDLTRDFSDDVESRDVLLDRLGHEAEWCIFDPILSTHYGKRYRQTRSTGDLERQIYHLDRALGQITPAWQCPELYYLKDGSYVPNPHTPLLWTQANLVVALSGMRASLGGA